MSEAWVQTPLGPGRVTRVQAKPVFIELPDGFRIRHREPYVSVMVEGYSAPHDFPLGAVTPLDRAPDLPLKEVPLTQQRFRRTDAPLPIKGPHKQVFSRIGAATFTFEDVRIALLSAIGDRKLKPVNNVGRRVGAVLRRAMKLGLVERAC